VSLLTTGKGYCDAQCGSAPWINGVANVNNSGACCSEMDIWEANSLATQLTPHACNVTGLYECTGAACGSSGVCDKLGCGLNPYGLDAHNFYGPSRNNTVNTAQPFTVVTQWLTDDGTSSGTLNQIKRYYIQNNKLIEEATVAFENTTLNSITNQYCDAMASTFEAQGGLAQIGRALQRGMVLIFVIWNDATGYMNWLDSGTAGPCNATQGNPTIIVKEDPGTSVTYSDVRWGDIGSTYCKYGV
jgi:cellulase